MPRDFILAFDIGTSSLRTALFDLQGKRVDGTLAQQAYPLQTNPEGQAELDPATLEKAARKCLIKTMAAFRTLNSNDRIVAAGCSCFWHSLLAIDAKGNPLSPIYTWAESRCKSAAEELRKRLDEKEYHQASGAMLRASFWPAKLSWLKKTQPSLFKKASSWLSPADWLFSRFCTSWHPSYSMASGTGLLARATNNWNDPLFKRFGITRAQVGTISDAPLTSTTATTSLFPELAATQWFPPIGDGAASNLGCGANAPGLAAINFGTSAAIRVISSAKNPKVPFGLFAYRVDADRWLIGGAISNAGNLRAWALQNLQLPDDEALEILFQKNPPPALTALPFLAAERAPSWPEDVAATLTGFNLSTTAVEIFSALTEASYLRLAQIGLLLQRNVVRGPLRVMLSGGLLKSPASMQRLTDALGCSITASTEPEGSLRGAAVFAIEHLGKKLPAVKPGKRYSPNAKRHALALIQLKKQQALEKLLSTSL